MNHQNIPWVTEHRSAGVSLSRATSLCSLSAT